MPAVFRPIILALVLVLLLDNGHALAADKKKDQPATPPAAAASDPAATATPTPEDLASEEKLLSQTKPPLWGTLKESLSLTAAYLQDPKAHAANLPLIQSLNKALIPLLQEDAAAQQTMRYILGPAMLNPAEHREGGYFEEISKITAIVKTDRKGRKFGKFRNDIGFDVLMGAIGQNSLENKKRFDQFTALSNGYDGRGNAWHDAYETHTQNVKALEEAHKPFQKVSRVASVIGQFAFAIPVGIFLPDILFGHVPPDVKLLSIGFTWELSKAPIGRAVAKFLGRYRDHWVGPQREAVQNSFRRLYEIDPERTVPLLVADATREQPRPKEGAHEPTTEEAERLKPLEDAALAVLLDQNDNDTTRALKELGIRYVRSGYLKGAEEVFAELARRDPGGKLDGLRNEIEAAIQESRSIKGLLNQFFTAERLGRVAIFGAPLAVGVALGSRQLEHEEKTLVITGIRELLVGSILVKFILGGKHGHDAHRKASAEHAKAEQRLYEAFSKLPGNGSYGLSLLRAFAENKLPGEAGAMIAKVATKVIHDTPGAEAAQVMRDLSRTDSASAAAVARASLEKEIGARAQWCAFDFSHIGKYRRK